MPRFKSLIALAARPFKARKTPTLVSMPQPIRPQAVERNPMAHDDWLFEDERQLDGEPDIMNRLAASLCRLRNCLSDIAEQAPLVMEARPPRYRVEFSDHSDLEDEFLFGDEPEVSDNAPAFAFHPGLFDDPSPSRYERPGL